MKLNINGEEHLIPPISGDMGKGGGGGKESPDSAVATQSVKTLIAVNDGEMYQVENIYLNGLPIANYSHLGVGWDWRRGLPDQTLIGDFIDTEAPINSFKTTKLDYQIPIKITVPFEANAVRLTFQVKTLRQAKTNGNIIGYWTFIDIKTKANFSALETHVGRAWQVGKYSSTFAWDVIVDRPSGSYENQTDWVIVLRRETWDDEQMGVKYESETSVVSAVQLFYKNLTYPNTALIYIGFTNAKIFGGAIPEIKFKLKGRVMYLPDNYDPATKTYTGVWIGNFKTNTEYSNNPVWILLDVLTRVMTVPVALENIDIGNFYLCAQYCDALVSNGLGGTEPRYTFNYCFNEKLKEPDFFLYILTVINGTFATNKFGQLALSMDMEGVDASTIITNSNVIDGEFIYTSNELEQRYSQVNVTWDDPRYKGGSTTSIILSNGDNLVNGQDLRQRYGLRLYSIDLKGCTTYGQAIRKGRHELWLNSIETEFVSFKVFLEGMVLQIGQLFKLVDTTNYDSIYEGRVASYELMAGGIILTLDKWIPAFSADHYISYHDVDGNYINYYQTSHSNDVGGYGNLVYLFWSETQPEAIPYPGGVFSLEIAESSAKLFRIVSLSESDKMYTVNARIHDESKYNYIDSLTTITVPIYTPDAAHRVPPPVYDLVMMETIVGLSYQLQVTWGWEPEEGITSYATYNLTWKRDWGNVNYVTGINTNGYDIFPAIPGVYEVFVQAVDTVSGMPSAAIGQSYFFKVSEGKSTLFSPINVQLYGNG